ncbi:NERD domain-containing protein/DEAD/DEAH box helicase [Yersinia intermedia]|uniref:NERD domain-containing protein/DEAD/DEAH box helicase n=1 Tax=Yersinia intermedia TaxID=631 RepID=UPI0022FF36DB|nr:NERD domain-containing protein/DEAD/DEAH box helicase [Yersinia intermedia]MDA5483382.1 NERD domain-containing protein/DEAD/DEAH box helicase [Yersinia intermedia]
MAELIPTLNSCAEKMTPGERRLAKRIEVSLSNDCLCWYDIPVGQQRRYPDFIILNPERGLLFLEVKDWRIEHLHKIDKATVEYRQNNELITRPNPIEQVRQCSYAVINQLKTDRQLLQQEDRYKGSLCVAYGYGVVFSNITRKQLNNAIPVDEQVNLLPPHLVICCDEITDAVSNESFNQAIWALFPYQFKTALTSVQRDRIRWHLFPEIRITHTQADFFQTDETDIGRASYPSAPDIIRIMDIQQELLARSLGEGHRVIHGVAGSGKTLILLYRCLYLAEVLTTPILVLCYNMTLAARLKCQIAERGLEDRIQVFHFHGWCKDQCQKYSINVNALEDKPWEQHVEAVIDAVREGKIPKEQYGALLIDEGHDFDSAWLALVTQMVDTKTNALLFMYDDAQSIYRKRGALGFSLASVGIQAQGRTSVLRLNYRNTKEILAFSYLFAQQHFDSRDDMHTAFMPPEAAGMQGVAPELKSFESLSKEVSHLISWIKNEHSEGVCWRDMAILCPSNSVGKYLEIALANTDIPHTHLFTAYDKKRYNPTDNHVCILPLPSSKGLEFHSVAIIDSSHILNDGQDLADEARRLYVGFTRATQHLLVTWHQNNVLSTSLEKSFSYSDV